MTLEHLPDDVKEAAVEAANRVLQRTSRFPRRLRLGNGIVLAYKNISIDTLSAAESAVALPPVPRVMNEARGIEEDNPSDPNYITALVKARGDREKAKMTLALLIGTEVAEIPDGMYGPDDDAWITELREGFEHLRTPIVIHDELGSRARYLDWIMLYALEDGIDQFRVSRALIGGYALTEEEIARAAESFRRDVVRASDSIGADATPAFDGDRDPDGDRRDG